MWLLLTITFRGPFFGAGSGLMFWVAFGYLFWIQIVLFSPVPEFPWDLLDYSVNPLLCGHGEPTAASRQRSGVLWVHVSTQHQLSFS